MSGFDKPGVEVYINKLSLRMIAVQACVKQAYIAQSVEHVLGKDEVIGSSPIVGSIFSVLVKTKKSIQIKTNSNGKKQPEEKNG